MKVYYNDNNAFCCAVLRKQIAAGNLYEGFVDERDVKHVRAEELREYGQIHLFAGIGGFPLGLRWAGMPAGKRILTGGFPCQPFSSSGSHKGNSDNRYLWPEMSRFVRAVRPEYVVAENVLGLVNKFPHVLDEIYSDLEGMGYEVIPPLIVPACAFGAPHIRYRVWIVAHALRYRQPQQETSDAAACHEERNNPAHREDWQAIAGSPDSSGENAAHSDRRRCEKPDVSKGWRTQGRRKADACRMGAYRENRANRVSVPCERWESEPAICRVVDGVSKELDEALAALGNSIVPQIAEYIAKAIKQAEASYREAIGERVDG